MRKVIKNNKILLKLLIIISTFTGCLQKNKIKKSRYTSKIKKLELTKKSKNITKEEHVITIWIHGTRSVHTIVLRNFFFRKLGLHLATSYEKKHNAHKIATTVQNQKTKRFNVNNFYIFGWSGKLSPNKRTDAAKNLNISILKIIKQYKAKHGIVPKIRLVTHSHGGNVALLLAKINKKQATKIKIYELVLLACPVQEKTAQLISNKMFENIYSIYSGMDMIQVLDPQGLHEVSKKKLGKHLFSLRLFSPQKNLIQTKLKINGRGILHVEFLTEKFMKLLPYILESMDSCKDEYLTNPNAYKKYHILKIKIQNNHAYFEQKILKKQFIKKRSKSTIR